MATDLTVVVSTLNGAARIERALDALEAQTVHTALEIIVVDDGSSDGTGAIARARGCTVIRHKRNMGVSAARNTGLRAATSPIVAFIDDDCEPVPEWAELLVAGYHDDSVTGIGGPVIPVTGDGFLSRYVDRNNRHEPLELELAVSQALPYRFYLYLRRQWAPPNAAKPRREIYAPTGGNMSFRRAALLAVGGFDERFRFGSEEEDLARRLRRRGDARLICVPEARVGHRYEPTMRAITQRCLAYSKGNALQYRKWPGVRPTLFPWPVLITMLLAGSVWLWPLAVVALILPQFLYPACLRNAMSHRAVEALADPYLRLFQEAAENIGFLRGAWTLRDFPQEPAVDTRPGTAHAPSLRVDPERTA